MKEVVEETKSANATTAAKKRIQDEVLQEYTSSRQLSSKAKAQSKFSKRFNMLSTNAITVEITDRQNTPSTTTSEISSDENQWIKRPPLPSLYDPSKSSDPQALAQQLTPKEHAVI